MGNIIENDSNGTRLIGKTIIDNDNNSIALIIPSEFAKELGIESSMVSMSLLKDFDGNKHLLVSKYHREITIE